MALKGIRASQIYLYTSIQLVNLWHIRKDQMLNGSNLQIIVVVNQK